MLLTNAQAAEYLGTSAKSLTVLRNAGRINIPYLKWGNRIKYEKDDLDKWIKSNKQK